MTRYDDKEAKQIMMRASGRVHSCEACDREWLNIALEQWTWIWSEAASRSLCFCPDCAAKLPPASEDIRVVS